MEKQKIIQAGEISKKIKEYAKSIIKKGVPLLEIADKIDEKIEDLGGKPAFPINLSINDVAAHYTPGHDDETLAHGLLKVDIGIHVDGWTADTAFSLDLENSEENKKIIEASKEALTNVEKSITTESEISEIGRIIETTIRSKNLNPIVNLTGHSMDQYDLHSGASIPNIDNGSDFIFGEGLYAIEPFATNGVGKVKDGRPSGIYMLQNQKNTRSPIARELLKHILKDYSTLPFCSRWLVRKYGTKALLGLKQLEQEGILHHFPQLIEISGGIVSQAENTFLLEKNSVTITTKED
ncbi:MAG: type II methionyl aminopeptidase [Nanoarchaeota archaeon]|nr:type II methionyl aminopeptidase [Nanoarchaeota archaeon]